MIDDIRSDEARSGGFELSSNINRILEHQSHRTSAVRWARNLRFLTFGGDENCTDAKSSEGSDSTKQLDQDQCTRCEIRVTPPVGHICAYHKNRLSSSDISKYEKLAKEYNNPCIHVEHASCEECMQIPLFPNRGRATKFRIRRLKPKGTKQCELGICTHFVAVSYCWPSSSAQKLGETKRDGEQYQVLEEDMKTARSIRAPKDTIDRAVSFAAQNGFRMIWIDQECIEQDNEKEKELAIQAMDYVYVQAQISIGLFQATLEQRHLDALLHVFESSIGPELPRRGPHPLKQRQLLPLQTLAEALSIVAMDRWNTRAWILQEAFVSAGNMVLLFPRAKGIVVKGWSLICHDMSLTEIAIKLIILHECISECTGYLAQRPGRSVSIKLPEWAETVKRLAWFQPDISDSHMFDFSCGSLKTRHTSNAAVALSFLKHRDNDRIADRLAILANLCDYSLRLNTREVEKSQSHLSVCILALTIANGDFSLLSPESYRIPRGIHIAQNKSKQDFTWVPSDVKRFQYIRSTIADPGRATLGRASPYFYRATNEGLSLLGFMWKMDHFIEMASTKDKYKEAWSRLWRSNTRLGEQSLEETENPAISREMPRTHLLAVTQIIFEVIQQLCEDNQLSIADAIWHSVMNADWRKGEYIDTVAEFPEQLTVEKRKEMFRFGQSWDGSFQHKWLLDRIMLQGGFWVGRLVQLSTDHDYRDKFSTKDGENDHASRDDQIDSAVRYQQPEDHFRSPAQEHAKLNMEMLGAASAFQADSIAMDAGQRSPLPSVDRSSVAAPPLSWRQGTRSLVPCRISTNAHKQILGTHSGYQLLASMMMKSIDHTAVTRNPTEESSDYTTDPDADFGIIPLTFAEVLASFNENNGKNSEAFLRQQRAIFDIEGDTSRQVLVLTPFPKRLETIPRPETQGMSVSWVVQPVSRFNGSQNDADSKFFKKRERLKTLGMVRGMWKLMVQPVNAYNLI